MFAEQPPHFKYAAELRQPPPKGTPYSVPLEGTEKPGRTKVYRAWNMQKELFLTLDPRVTTIHELFELSGELSLFPPLSPRSNGTRLMLCSKSRPQRSVSGLAAVRSQDQVLWSVPMDGL